VAAAVLDSIQNYQESLVQQCIRSTAPQHPRIEHSAALLADVACVALNSLRPRYIRHSIDLHFFASDEERQENEAAVKSAVAAAFSYVESHLRPEPS